MRRWRLESIKHAHFSYERAHANGDIGTATDRSKNLWIRPYRDALRSSRSIIHSWAIGENADYGRRTLAKFIYYCL
jgi:hypothetical protein